MRITCLGATTRTTLTAILAATLAVSAGCSGVSNKEAKGREMDGALRALVGGSQRPAFATADAEGDRLWKRTQEFYQKREFVPAWIENAAPRPQMEALTKALREAHDEGLDPELYNVSLLEQRRTAASKGFLSQKGFDPREAGSLDVWLTYLYMKYASDLADGLSDLATADPAWKIEPEKFDALAHLERALEENRIGESLRELTPKAKDYQALRTALAEYRGIKDKGGWQPVPKVKLKPGQKSPALAAIAKRLAATGDFKGQAPADNDHSATYGPQLQEAVKRFQRRHGLTDDGAVGPEMVAEMNVPVEARIKQIELNMERWRWLPRDLGDRHILVNIPEMRLDVWEQGKVPLSMRVVVGRKDTQTPVFNDQMTHIVFSPYWNVPDSIAQGETLPAMMKDPAFLSRNNMEVIDASGQAVDASSVDFDDPSKYRFRQRPGGTNSLGLVKFMFPNQFNVYLHDTPADSLFTRASRSFSHGCVRLENPVALAQYVLKDQPEWTKERIEEAMASGEEKHVKLKGAIPVYLGYWTASVGNDGILQFRKDVYGIDGQLVTKVNDRLNRLRKSTAAANEVVTPVPATGKAASK
jgi:murein L,D-transpeptidase YcbB/YkuD